jgi:hypothetical protein
MKFQIKYLNDRKIIKKLLNSSQELRINCEGFLYDLKLPQLRLDSNSEDKDAKVSMLKIFLNGTLLAIIIAVPAIISTVLFHYVIKTNLIITITAGIITLFVAMGFAYKVSKKLAL